MMCGWDFFRGIFFFHAYYSYSPLFSYLEKVKSQNRQNY